MKEVKITNLIKFYTLLFLYKKSMYGYELIKQLEICTGKTGPSILTMLIISFLKLARSTI